MQLHLPGLLLLGCSYHHIVGGEYHLFVLERLFHALVVVTFCLALYQERNTALFETSASLAPVSDHEHLLGTVMLLDTHHPSDRVHTLSHTPPFLPFLHRHSIGVGVEDILVNHVFPMDGQEQLLVPLWLDHHSVDLEQAVLPGIDYTLWVVLHETHDLLVVLAA